MSQTADAASEVRADLRGIDHLIRDGNLASAQKACKDLLQRYPTSAAAHEKMGDIMYRRELWEDAGEWYELAQQLADSPELREKIEDTRQRAIEARTGPEPVLLGATASPRRRLIWLIAGAVAMIIVVVLLIAGLSGNQEEQPIERPAIAAADEDAGPSRGPRLTAPSTVRGTSRTPAPTTRGARSIPQARENPSQHWAAQPAAPRRAPRRPISREAREDLPEPLTDHDRLVIDTVSSLTWGDNRPMTGRVSAMIDPYAGYGIIRVSVPTSLPTDRLVERVVKQAYRVAMAAFRADEALNSMTVQMVTTAANGERVVAFRGNTNRIAMRRLGDQDPSLKQIWNNFFADAWWNPQAPGEVPEELAREMQQSGVSGNRGGQR